MEYGLLNQAMTGSTKARRLGGSRGKGVISPWPNGYNATMTTKIKERTKNSHRPNPMKIDRVTIREFFPPSPKDLELSPIPKGPN